MSAAAAAAAHPNRHNQGAHSPSLPSSPTSCGMRKRFTAFPSTDDFGSEAGGLSGAASPSSANMSRCVSFRKDSHRRHSNANFTRSNSMISTAAFGDVPYLSDDDAGSPSSLEASRRSSRRFSRFALPEYSPDRFVNDDAFFEDSIKEDEQEDGASPIAAKLPSPAAAITDVQKEENEDTTPAATTTTVEREDAAEEHLPEVTSFDENGLAPIVTHFEPPTAPHRFESATMFFLCYGFGGAAGLAATVLALIAGVPLLSHATGVPMYLLYLAMWAAGTLNYVISNTLFWYQHMRPATSTDDGEEGDKKKKSFLMRRVGTRPHKQRKGKTVWYPKLGEEESKKRGFAPYGISLSRYLFDLFTWALEYKVCGFFRAVCCDFNIGQYASTQNSHEDIYYFIINSSMACFIDVQDDGKLKLFENKVAHMNGSTVYMYKVVGELDHENKRHIRTCIQWEEARDGCPVKVTTITDPTEAMHIYGLLGALKTHVHVHWWANAVKDLEGKWPLAGLSAGLTQGFNSAAQFTAGPMFGREDAEGARAILLPNAATEGIPVHSDMGRIAENSDSHRMVKACRTKLKTGVAKHLSALEIEAILQATVMHAMDHYSLSAALPWRCYSHFLGAELTPYRTTLIHGCSYRTRSLLCRHYKDQDPICATIYECCREVDAVFADEYLSVGIAA